MVGGVSPPFRIGSIMQTRDMLKAVRAWGLVCACWLAHTGWVWAQAYVDRYDLSAASPALDLGVQPLGYPSGVISAVMRRDRILQGALAAAGHPLKAHPFRRGADMIGLLNDRRLEAALLGDMPTILTAVEGPLWIVGLVKQSSTAIVARNGATLRDLEGRRIGYVPLSSAHHTLLQGLVATGLSEGDVRLVAMGIDEMPQALARGEIDAFSGWEPATTVAIRMSERHHVVFRGMTQDYFVMDRRFEEKSPAVARALIAGFVRALEWMRRSQNHLDMAARWVRLDSEAFTGQEAVLAPDQIAAITRREILMVPSAPSILTGTGELWPLQAEFEFLRKQGKLPEKASWQTLRAAFAYDGLRQVMADPRGYGWRVFDYAD